MGLGEEFGNEPWVAPSSTEILLRNACNITMGFGLDHCTIEQHVGRFTTAQWLIRDEAGGTLRSLGRNLLDVLGEEQIW